MMLGSSERRKGFAGKKGRTPSFLPSLFWWKAQAKLQESSFDSNSRDIQGITAAQGWLKKAEHRLRVLADAARDNEDTGSCNLWPFILAHPVHRLSHK